MLRIALAGLLRPLLIVALFLLPACGSDQPPPPSPRTLNDVANLTRSSRSRLTAAGMQDYLNTEPIEVQPGLLRWRLADGDLYTHYKVADDGQRDLIEAAASKPLGQ